MKKSLGYTEEQILTRKKQIKQIKDYFCFNDFYDMGLKPAHLESYEAGEVIGRIGKYIQDIKPNWIILPDYNDAHSDHKVVFEWCFSCTKVFRCPSINKITTMEIISETDFGKPYNPFIANYFINISEFMEKKLEAIEIYKSELGEHPFPRNKEAIKANGILRGVNAGVLYAEAFRLIKSIE